jgi:hypothetical protein
MDKDFLIKASTRWHAYFPGVDMPVGIFYADEPGDAFEVNAPAENRRGYTCMFSQMSRMWHGEPIAFSAETIGCWGGLATLFGGPYQEDVTVNLLVNIEHFCKGREEVLKQHALDAEAKPTGRYFIVKPFEKLTEQDEPLAYVAFVNADMLAALQALACFDDARADAVIAPFTSGCMQTFGYSMREARQNHPRCIISSLDPAMRACIRKDLLSFSMPARKFEQMVENMPDTFLGTYIWNDGMKKRLTAK